MIKRTLDECRGKFKDGRWELRNLKFLEEFMRQMEVSTGDVAKALGLTRNAVTRWFIYDNTSVVNAGKVAAVYGYELVISYAGKRARKPKIENTTLVISVVIRGDISGTAAFGWPFLFALLCRDKTINATKDLKRTVKGLLCYGNIRTFAVCWKIKVS